MVLAPSRVIRYVGVVEYLSCKHVAAILRWLQSVRHRCRESLTRLRVNSALVLTDATADAILERLRYRIDFGAVEMLGVWRVRG